LERRPLTDSEPSTVGRRNIVRAYNEIARRLGEASIVEHPEFTICRGPAGMPLANYVIDFRSPSIKATRQRIRSLVAGATALRAICLPGDQPTGVEAELFALGFRPVMQLETMFLRHAPAVRAGPHCSWASAHERRDVASWMTGFFFRSLDPSTQAAIARAMAASVHHLVKCSFMGTMIAAAMVVEDEESLGLYNLCVAESHRGQSWGKRVVSWIGQQARYQQKHLVLQCADGLVPWYMLQGFESAGRITLMEKGSRNPMIPYRGDV
jgi:hypothetical protein